MSIPQSQLDIWAKQGSIDLSKTTYASIKTALEASTSPIAQKISNGSIEVRLQGSYANDTNIRADSDIDVLVRLVHTFNSNKDTLEIDQRILHDSCYVNATYKWSDLRNDVISALVSYYGSSTIDVSGKKSIKVLKGNSGRVPADIVPVLTYREYKYFFGSQDSQHSKDEGVCFHRMDTNDLVINYPKQHLDNGSVKHQNTNFHFKRQVRIFKNAKSYLVDKGYLNKGDAPSYFLQSLIYNVPTDFFIGTDTDVTLNILRYLSSNDISKFIMQNRKYLLIGTGDVQWNINDANKTVVALCNLWDNWYSI
jgi:predicted nucleotidyltransferase